MDVKSLCLLPLKPLLYAHLVVMYVMAQHRHAEQHYLTSIQFMDQSSHRCRCKSQSIGQYYSFKRECFGLYALDSEGQLWTWGHSTYLGDNNPATIARFLPKKMILPSTGSIKMVGATGSIYRREITYYVLYGDGRLFALSGMVWVVSWATGA